MHICLFLLEVHTLSWISDGELLKENVKKNFDKCHFNCLQHSTKYDCMFLMSTGKFGYLSTCICCECSVLVFERRVMSLEDRR